MNAQDVLRDVHDPVNHALQTTGGSANSTVYLGTPTIFAVVNTGAAGIQNSIVTVANTVPVTGTFYQETQPVSGTVSTNLNAGVNNIGFATVYVSTPTLYAVVNTGAVASSNVTLDAGSKTGIVGNVTIDSYPALPVGLNYIGFATVNVVGTVPVSGAFYQETQPVSGTFWQATQPVSGTVIANLGAGVNGIGFATVNVVNQPALVAGAAYIGLVSIQGNVNASNAGTTKTLIHKNIELSTSSVATIAVATGGNAIFNITNLVLNSDATVRMSIKSGATYLTGNASIGLTLNPGGGWVETGSPDSPTYIGLASGAAIVLEKFDMTGTSAKVGGKVIYFQE